MLFLAAECAKLLPHLLTMTEELRSEGESLQAELRAFENELRTIVDKVWARFEADKAPDQETLQKEKEVPKKPIIGPDAWSLSFLVAS